MSKPIFIAHRGYAAAYPENSLLALQAAKNVGAEYVEVDIQLSKDHVPVLFHDRDLNRLCQQNGAIHNYTFSELENFMLTDSEKFSNLYVDNKITSLQSFVEFLKENPNLKAFIELKRSMITIFGEDLVLEKVLPMFENMEKQISFISYNQNILKTIHNTTSFDIGVVVDQWSEYKVEKNNQPQWLFCSVEGLTSGNDEIKKLQSNSTKIAVFEVGNIGVAKHLFAKGINYLETFRIKEMLENFNGEK
ncbi:MAG: glycerophosphodiester phosphodiesterase family protein [Woeseiaceae bacterium]